MIIDPHAYNISIRRGLFDGEALFEARVRELPDVTEYGETFEEAYDLAVDTIETTAKLLTEKGRVMPPPQKPADDFSGRITLRLPKSLHRSLVEFAESEGVSLNQYLVSVLGYFSGYEAGRPVTASFDWYPASASSLGKPSPRQDLRLVHSVDLQSVASWN